MVVKQKNTPRGMFSLCAPSRIYSEPPSLKSGGNTMQKDYLSKNLIENWEIVKKLKCFQANIYSSALHTKLIALQANGVCWWQVGGTRRAVETMQA